MTDQLAIPVHYPDLRDALTTARDRAQYLAMPADDVISYIDAIDEMAEASDTITLTGDPQALHDALAQARAIAESAPGNERNSILGRIAYVSEYFATRHNRAFLSARAHSLAGGENLPLDDVAAILNEQLPDHDLLPVLTPAESGGLIAESPGWQQTVPDDVYMLHSWIESARANCTTTSQRDILSRVQMITCDEEHILFRQRSQGRVSYIADGHNTYGLALMDTLSELLAPANYRASEYPDAMTSFIEAVFGKDRTEGL